MTQHQNLFILGEFYFKKGNFTSAKEIFTKLSSEAPESFPFPYFLGKIESSQGHYADAIPYLERTRSLNPFHKQTLLLLSKCYAQSAMYKEALECMVDSYLLCKETKDERIDAYKKEIRTLAKNLPGMDDAQKNKLIKDRLHILHEQLLNLEKTLVHTAAAHSLPEIDPLQTIPDIQTKDLDLHIEEKPEAEEDVEKLAFTPIEEVAEPVVDDADDDYPPLPEVPDNVVAPNFGISQNTNVDFTRHILFKSLSVQEIDKIGQFSTIQTFQKGETIHHPLEPIYGFSCLLNGKIEVLNQGEKLLELESGSIIDEAELCNGDKYFFETRAVEPTTILLVNKAALLTLCKRKHELAVHFLWHFYKSLSLKINSILENIMLQNPSQDMVWTVDRMKEISQQRSLNELEIDFLTRKAKRLIHQKGDFIFKNQAHVEHFYILLEGELTLDHPYAKDQVTLQPGEIFSEIALTSNLFEHTMNAKVTSEHAVVLQIGKKELANLSEADDRDNYRMMEFLWNVFSKKYFEFLNFYYHLLKS